MPLKLASANVGLEFIKPGGMFITWKHGGTEMHRPCSLTVGFSTCAVSQCDVNSEFPGFGECFEP